MHFYLISSLNPYQRFTTIIGVHYTCRHMYLLCIGIEVHYVAPVAGQPTGLIRCLLLLWTGDYPAQSEIGKFICHGIHPYRRCELEGILIQ